MSTFAQRCDTFLSSLKGARPPVVLVHGSTFPVSFFRLLVSHIASTLDCNKTLYDLSLGLKNVGPLETSFLGQHQCISLGNLDSLDKKKQKEWLFYLKRYGGPHVLIVFTSDPSLAKDASETVLRVPERLTFTECCQVSQLFDVPAPRSVSVLAKQNVSLSVDEALMLCAYGALSGRGIDAFVTEWCDQLFSTQESLFSLAQDFFAQKSGACIDRWERVYHHYSDMFWVSYWADQLWRAHHYCAARSNKDMVGAKQWSYRLPFSFIQRDWKRYSTDQFIQAYDRVYTIDYRLKNGCGSNGWAPFFSTAFQR